jgi:hypothetical protein
MHRPGDSVMHRLGDSVEIRLGDSVKIRLGDSVITRLGDSLGDVPIMVVCAIPNQTLLCSSYCHWPVTDEDSMHPDPSSREQHISPTRQLRRLLDHSAVASSPRPHVPCS